MSLKEYFLGSETAKAIRGNHARVNRIAERRKDEKLDETETNQYIRLELGLSKWAPNIISAGSIIASVVFREPQFLWGVAAGEGFRIFQERNTLRNHRDYYRKTKYRKS